jgi:hypothetical protein
MDRISASTSTEFGIPLMLFVFNILEVGWMTEGFGQSNSRDFIILNKVSFL